MLQYLRSASSGLQNLSRIYPGSGYPCQVCGWLYPAMQSAGVSTCEKPVKTRENPAFTKVDNAEFKSIFTPELESLVALFKKYNYELRIAGGAVRDILMKIKPTDIDFATTATPAQMTDMFTKEQVRMINCKGEKHGTITPRINNNVNFEVTTLRIDVKCDGRHSEVQFTKDWQLDANRRDLTINSMFLGLDGTVYDYFYGYEDLQNRRVVFVGDADTRIKEDFLRILRYFRFYGRIARDTKSHDAETLTAIKLNSAGLGKISGERIWTELQKIVNGKFAPELVREMYKSNLMKYCGLPVEPNMKEFDRLCNDLKQFKGPHYSILYLISLLFEKEDVITLHERLKLSAFDRDLALFITAERKRVDNDLQNLRDYQIFSMQPFVKREYVLELLKYGNKKELYNEFKAWNMPTFPVNGNTLKSYGLVGRKVGIILAELRHAWAKSGFELSAEELLEKHLPSILGRRSPSPMVEPSKKARS